MYALPASAAGTCGLTHDSGDEGNGVLRGEESEEPRGSVVERGDLVLAEVSVEGCELIVEETRELVEPQLWCVCVCVGVWVWVGGV